MARIQSLDILKFLAMFLVLWGHAIQYFSSNVANADVVYRVIYSFHMPLFMMVAGYFASSSLKGDFITLIKKKGAQLLLPVLSWAVLCVVVGLLISSGNSITHELNRLFWFLKSLFVCYLLFYVSIKTLNNNKLKLISVGFSLIISQFIVFGQLPTLYPAFILGYIISQNRTEFNRRMNFIIIISLSFWISFLIMNELYFIPDNPLPFRFPMQKRLIEILGKLGGAVFFFSLVSFFFFNESNARFAVIISSWGQLTMGIYILQILQTFILERGLGSLLKFDDLTLPIFDFVMTPLIALIIMTICVALIKQIQRNRYLSLFLLGENVK